MTRSSLKDTALVVIIVLGVVGIATCIYYLTSDYDTIGDIRNKHLPVGKMLVSTNHDDTLRFIELRMTRFEENWVYKTVPWIQANYEKYDVIWRVS